MREEKSLGWEAGIAGTNDILDNKSRRLFFSASMSFQSRNYWVIGVLFITIYKYSRGLPYIDSLIRSLSEEKKRFPDGEWDRC